MRELQGRRESLCALAFTADNRFLAVGGGARRLDVWDLANPAAKRPLFPKAARAIGHLWISPDGEEILAAELYFGAVARHRRADPKALEGLAPFKPDVRFGSSAPPRILPDGSGVLSGEESVALWKFDSGTAPVWQAAPGDTDNLNASAFALSPDGKRAAECAVVTRDEVDVYVIRTYAVKTRKKPREFGVVSQPAQRLAFSPDGEALVAAVDNRVLAWRADGTRACDVRLASRKHVTELAFHPSGKWLATADNSGAVRLFDTGTWAEARAFAWGLSKARTVCFSPDGTLAAAGSDTGKVVVWDVDL